MTPETTRTLDACVPQDARVLVTPTSFGKQNPSLKARLESAVREVVYNPFDRPMRSAELVPLICEADGYIAGLDEIDTEVIEAAERLRVIARYGVGADRIDLAAATRRGILVTNTPGANAIAVAELTIGLILSLSRQLCPANQATRQGGWPRITGIGLYGKTAGLIGLGAIGSQVAARLAGFGCTLLANDPNVDQQSARQQSVTLVSLDELLSRADFVSLHLPAGPETRRMVDATFLKQMKPGALLINTARGELVDEAALVRALRNNWIGGAALDCFDPEPPGAEHPMALFPNVIFTPHSGAHTDQAMDQMGIMSLESCLAALRGERPEHLVNPEATDHPRWAEHGG